MNTPDTSTVNAPAKISFSSATRASMLGLALLLTSAAALATLIELVVVVAVIAILQTAGGFADSVPTNKDGTYQFKGLAPGDYYLSVDGKRVKTITVGADGGIKGVLSRQPDGTASITFNGQVALVPTILGQAERSIASPLLVPTILGQAERSIPSPLKDEVKQRMPKAEELPGKAAPKKTSTHKKAGIAKAEEPQPDDLPGAPVSTTRSNKKARIVESEGPPPDVLPGKRGAPGLPGPTIAVGIAKAEEPVREDVKPGISDQGAIGNLSTYATAPPPKSGEGKLPGLAGDPIPGLDVKLVKNPDGGIVASSKTDGTGTFHFDKLPAGEYKLKVDGLPGQSLTVGTDGIAGGTLIKGSDGSISIFDRWGNRPNKPHFEKDRLVEEVAVQKPVDFGSGNTGFGGPGPGMMGGGMTPPGAAMGGAGPMSPGGHGPMNPMGPSPMGGSPGGGMRH